MAIVWPRPRFLRPLVLLIALLGVTPPAVVTALEVGAPAPDFKLPSTDGVDISLSEFKGKKHVLLEFYGADFAPA